MISEAPLALAEQLIRELKRELQRDRLDRRLIERVPFVLVELRGQDVLVDSVIPVNVLTEERHLCRRDRRLRPVDLVEVHGVVQAGDTALVVALHVSVLEVLHLLPDLFIVGKVGVLQVSLEVRRALYKVLDALAGRVDQLQRAPELCVRRRSDEALLAEPCPQVDDLLVGHYILLAVVVPEEAEQQDAVLGLVDPEGPDRDRDDARHPRVVIRVEDDRERVRLPDQRRRHLIKRVVRRHLRRPSEGQQLRERVVPDRHALGVVPDVLGRELPDLRRYRVRDRPDDVGLVHIPVV